MGNKQSKKTNNESKKVITTKDEYNRRYYGDDQAIIYELSKSPDLTEKDARAIMKMNRYALLSNNNTSFECNDPVDVEDDLLL